MAADRLVKASRPALVPLTVIAAVVGLAPVALFLGRPRLLLYAAAASALSAILYAALLGIKSSATNSPGFWEFLLAGLSAVYLPAIGGLLSLLGYVAVYGLAWLLRYPVNWLGMPAQIDPPSIGNLAAAVLTVLGGLGSGAGIRRLRDQLYPDVAGLKSAFYDLISQKQRRLVGCTIAPMLVLGAALAVLAVATDAGKWIYVLAQAYLAVISAGLWSAGEFSMRSLAEIYAIQRLLEAVGYQVTPSPRTGDEAVDPLLVNVDLFAHSAERALAVQVRTPGQTPDAVGWTAASALQAAAWRLNSVNRESDLTPHVVEPLMVLVGIEPDDSLRSFSEEEGFGLVEISDKEFADIRTAFGREDRQELARRHLGLFAGAGGATEPDGDEHAPGGQP